MPGRSDYLENNPSTRLGRGHPDKGLPLPGAGLPVRGPPSLALGVKPPRALGSTFAQWRAKFLGR